MSQPFIGEIRMFGGNFAPVGWALCNGQLMAISQNDALFQLIGTTYGGDGVNTFALPDLQGRIPLHEGNGFIQGQLAGSETITLLTSQIPLHTHVVGAANVASSANPAGGVFGGGPALFTANPAAPMNAGMIALNTGGQPHDNMMPFLAVNFIIALFGIFPSQN